VSEQPERAAFIRRLTAIVGERFVIHRPEDLLVYEYDGTIDRGHPWAVALPDSAEQVAALVRVAAEYGIPIVPRGAGTGLSGGALAEAGGLVIGTARLRRILEVDVDNRIAVVEPGLVNLDLSKAVARYGLYYAPDPSSQRACTIGGNIAENAGGPHCLALGVTTNHVLGIEAVFADGTIAWLGGRTSESPGYDLRAAMIGSEGTLAIATKVCVRLLPKPEAVRTMLAGFAAVRNASDAVSAVIGAGVVPAALEMMDRVTLDAVEAGSGPSYSNGAEAVLLIEVEGLREAVEEDAHQVEAVCRAAGAISFRGAQEEAERERLWSGRKGAIGALGRIAPNYYILDGVVPRTRLPEVLDAVNAACKRQGFPVANVFHAGDGNLHPCVLFDERTEGATSRVLDVGGEIMRLCVDAGGSITGEHGVGVEKRSYMEWIYSPSDLEAMQRLKRAFGAGAHFNPCKAFPTHKGCGEVYSQSAALRVLGPEAYV
jgi:glycolate oxidase